jgi:tyrosine-protein kinase Etk/Wzc
MNENKLEFLDFVVLLARWKKVLVVVFFLSSAVAYLAARFLLEPEYEASATIIPSMETNGMVGLSAMLKDFSSALPSGLSSLKQESEMDLYTTVLYSRSSLEAMIDKFDLSHLYKLTDPLDHDELLKAAKKSISANITLESAYAISVRSKSPKLAADITNYLVKYLNDKVIELRVAKAKNNRIFLEQRYSEIKENVAKAEDSLRLYQERTGILEVGKQTMATIEAMAKLESDMAVKEIEFNVLNKIYGANSPMVNSAKYSMNEYKSAVEGLKDGSRKSDVFMQIKKLPKETMQYYIYFRDVKIYNMLLEFIMPVYEQAKFDEQKNMPVMQIIDRAIPPVKKAFPPRMLIGLIVGFSMLGFTMFYIIAKELLAKSDNPKVALALREILRFKKT